MAFDSILQWAGILAVVLLFFGPGRLILRWFFGLSLLVVAFLDIASGDVLGDDL